MPSSAPAPLPATAWITRQKAADRLDCTYATVRRLELDGKLIAHRSKDGIYLVDPESVEALLRTGWRSQLGRPARNWEPRIVGAVEARVCELIEAGKLPREIVRECKVSFEEVHRIYRDYHEDFDEERPSHAERESSLVRDTLVAVQREIERGKTARARKQLLKRLATNGKAR